MAARVRPSKDSNLAKRRNLDYAAPASGLILLTRDRADEVDDPTTDLRIPDPEERLVELDAFRARQEIDNEMGWLPLLQPGRLGGTARRVLEEERDRDRQDPGDVLKATRTDPVGTFFVFLDLLKRYSELLTKLLLTHAEHHASQANSTSDVNVDWIWLFLVYH